LKSALCTIIAGSTSIPEHVTDTQTCLQHVEKCWTRREKEIKPSQTNSKNPTHPFTSPLCTVSTPSKQSGYEQKHCWQMCRIPNHTSPQQNPNRNEPQTKAKKKKENNREKKISLF
jgi:hypothetical protein